MIVVVEFFKNAISTIKDDFKRLLLCFLIILLANSLVLVLPVCINSILGEYFGDMNSSVAGAEEYFTDNLHSLERVSWVSLILGHLVACLICVVVSLFIYNIMKKQAQQNFKCGKSMPMTFLELVAVCGIVVLASCLASLVVSGLVSLVLGSILGVQISISVANFLILLLSEVLLSSVVQYVACVYLYNVK